MQCAVGAETETILAQCDVAGVIAIEILAHDFLGALADAPAQGLANADTFSRDPESHFDASIGLVLRGIAKLGFGALVPEPTLSRFSRDAIKQAECRGSDRRMRRAPPRHYRACFFYSGSGVTGPGISSSPATSPPRADGSSIPLGATATPQRRPRA